MKSVIFRFAYAMIVLGAGSSKVVAGPDVIVGAIDEIKFYPESGGITPIAIGTVSCNVGNRNLQWDRRTSNHPVIAQNLYRLKDGRFEQMGMSWLKHGFLALAGDLCNEGECNPPPSDQWLGVGCSDPYAARLNGTQRRLGPRFEVNPTTGEYPYPFTSPAFQDDIARRLQVLTAEIDQGNNSGALYFAEGQYVTRDDAAAGNGQNNVSYRQVQISRINGRFDARFSAPTVRQKPAIHAWAEQDRDVRLFEIDTPEGGRMVLGLKSSPHQNGFHNEIALYNQTSHRSARSVAISTTSGDISNPGFHDVHYHSGDGVGGQTRDSTDWPATVSEGNIRWSCDRFQDNPNANALSWGTLYNFWFNSLSSPSSATIQLFRPGAPTEPDEISISLVGGDVVAGRMIESTRASWLTTPSDFGFSTLKKNAWVKSPENVSCGTEVAQDLKVNSSHSSLRARCTRIPTMEGTTWDVEIMADSDCEEGYFEAVLTFVSSRTSKPVMVRISGFVQDK